MGFALSAWTDAARAEVEAALAPVGDTAWPASFAAAVRYPLHSGGKRVRPLLALAAAEAVGAPRAVALPGAVAVELVHTYSLVHDDLPCMDDDALRRGRPTAHVAFGEAVALLAGDALLTEAFAVLAGASLPAQARVDAIARLARASGASGMVGGQVGDVTWTGGGIDDLVAVHARKTGALIAAAVALGAICAGASAEERAALDRYGEAVGLAFQLADDVLDADEDDGDDGPPSYVRLLGVDATRERARALVADAIDAVATLPAPHALVALARFTVDRDV